MSEYQSKEKIKKLTQSILNKSKDAIDELRMFQLESLRDLNLSRIQFYQSSASLMIVISGIVLSLKGFELNWYSGISIFLPLFNLILIINFNRALIDNQKEEVDKSIKKLSDKHQKLKEAQAKAIESESLDPFLEEIKKLSDSEKETEKELNYFGEFVAVSVVITIVSLAFYLLEWSLTSFALIAIPLTLISCTDYIFYFTKFIFSIEKT